jgi:hypothetical protein
LVIVLDVYSLTLNSLSLGQDGAHFLFISFIALEPVGFMVGAMEMKSL